MCRFSPVSRFSLSLLPALIAILVARVPAGAQEPGIKAERTGNQIVFRAGEREVLRYQAEPGDLPRPEIKEAFRRGGYLHPVHTPSGKLVTDDFPSDHLHHHGVWFAWTKTEFQGRTPDFWNMGQGKARVEFVSVDDVWSKDGAAGFTAKHRFVDLATKPPTVALNETWQVTVSQSGGDKGTPVHIIDLVSTQTCATDDPLKLPKYHYGGLGFRGHSAWNGENNARFLTQAGETDRKKGNETRGNWCWIGGTVDGATAGVTILSHPSNFGSPQPMRLHPKEPFFCYAPQQLGDMAIEPGKPYVSRYRIMVADGEVKAEQAEEWWKQWTAGK